jgi:exodeoxyribonuclease V alpha subunit
VAYAATIHKSQGSEYPAVVLVGQKKAVAIAVRNVSGRRRWSKLLEWLKPAIAATT